MQTINPGLSAPMRCPRCGLSSPAEAARCDCGFDFQLREIRRPYFEQKFPKDLKIYLVIVASVNAALVALALASGDSERMMFLFVWSILVWWLSNRLLHKRNWARVALMFLTFPVGLLFLRSKELKLYCLQPPLQ